MMEAAALTLAAVGHACWDIVLHWMVVEDPDVSILHMHWLRMCFVALMLELVAIGKRCPNKPFVWWIRFSITGWVLPGTMYTTCVMLSGYRVAISFQTFIPLLVAVRISKILNWKQTSSLILSLCGTLAIWLYSPWQKHDIELWELWLSMLCIIVQDVAQQEWFVMMNYLKRGRIRAIAHGSAIAVILLFLSMIMWTPEHLHAAYMAKWDMWIIILMAAAITTCCKFLGIALFSEHMTCDGIAVYECLHPLATLFHDVLLQKDMIEAFDIIAILCLASGWILYPKRIYTSEILS